MAPEKVKRITFNADARLLAEARGVLGAGSTTATLNGALAEVVRQARLRSLSRRVFPDLTPEALAEMRQGRTGSS